MLNAALSAIWQMTF